MGLAVVAVGAGGVELVGHLLAGAVEVVLVGDGVGVDAGGDVVLVEDDVVGERLVVDELDGLALGDGDLVGLSFEWRGAREVSFLASCFRRKKPEAEKRALDGAATRNPNRKRLAPRSDARRPEADVSRWVSAEWHPDFDAAEIGLGRTRVRRECERR